MLTSSSTSSSLCSSSTRRSSPGVIMRDSNELCDHGGGDGDLQNLLFAPVTSCELMRVPQDYHDTFGYLHNMQLFFFDVLRKPNRMHIKDKRVCFITDYTINLAAQETGTVSRCSKIEDVAELICDVHSRAVGIRMNPRPFAVEPRDYLHWNCFYEMPVDLLLFAESAEQFTELMRVLRFVYQKCTKKDMQCRVLQQREEWGATLVLWPDGSRVKKNAMFYHRVPLSVHQDRTSAPAPSDGQQSVEVAQAHVTRSTAVPSRDTHSGVSLVTPPALHTPLPQPSSRPPEGVRRLEVDALVSRTFTRNAEPQKQMRSTVVGSHSATKRQQNPLAPEANNESEKVAASAAASVGRDARACRSILSDASILGSDDTMTGLFSPLTPASPGQKPRATSRVRALEAMVKEKQQCFREFLQFRYSKECELDNLNYHLNTLASSHGTLSSCEPLLYMQPIQLPKNQQGSSGDRKNTIASEREKRGTHNRHRDDDAGDNNGRHPSLARSLSSSSSIHEAQLVTVKPIRRSGCSMSERPAMDHRSSAASRAKDQCCAGSPQ
ncbi:hypothetical protein ABL78_4147 [Leptomonas seymouri]|uniref:Uncharacterized protein n=1 Tax=Leptomonas seymouri TaxID=5684 RepID=A0A0N1I3W2_LEPSE|nr:hypothetical protein ABL78_4147 [Leptomonas seymouri]|eukprot:KPI86778.1 hypothetical protein ABL78_4147 [Leptomonas seymouri]